MGEAGRPGRGSSRGRGSYGGGAQSPMLSLPDSRGNTPSPSPYSSTSDNQPSCHHCKQPDHMAKNCPQIKARKSRASERRQQEEQRASQAGSSGTNVPSQEQQTPQQGQQTPQQGQPSSRQGPSQIQQTHQPRTPNQRGKQVAQRSSCTLGSVKPGTESAGLGGWAQFGDQASQRALEKHARDQESIKQIAAERTSQGLAPTPGSVFHETQILRNPRGAPEILKKTFTDEPSLSSAPLRQPVAVDPASLSVNPLEVLGTPRQPIRTEFVYVPLSRNESPARQKPDSRKISVLPAIGTSSQPLLVSDLLPETTEVESSVNLPALTGQHEGQTDMLKTGDTSSNMPIVIGNPHFLVPDKVDNPPHLLTPSSPKTAGEQQGQVDPSVDGSTTSEPRSVLASVGAYLKKKIVDSVSLPSSQPAEELPTGDDPIQSIEQDDPHQSDFRDAADEGDLGSLVEEDGFQRVTREKSPSPAEGADRPDPPSLAEIAANHMRQSFEQADSEIQKRSASLSDKAFVHASKEYIDEKTNAVEQKIAKSHLARSGPSGPSNPSDTTGSLRSQKPKFQEEGSHGTKTHAANSHALTTDIPLKGKAILKSDDAPSVSTTSSLRRRPVAQLKQKQSVPPQEEPQDSSGQTTLRKLKESQENISQPTKDELNGLARGISDIARRSGMPPSEFLIGRGTEIQVEVAAKLIAKNAKSRDLREADYIAARPAGMFPEDEIGGLNYQRPWPQTSIEHLVGWILKHPFLAALWLIFTGVAYSFMLPPAFTPLLSDVGILNQGLVELPKTSLLRAGDAERNLEILFKEKVPDARVNSGTQHPCLEFLSNQVVDMKPLHEAERSALSFIYQGMLPRVQDTLFLPQVTMYNLSSIFHEISHASQHLENIDRRIMQHIHILHTDAHKCANIPDVPVTIISNLAAHLEKAKNRTSVFLQSFIRWLNEIQIVTQFIPTSLIPKGSNKEDANTQVVLTKRKPTIAVNATVFDEHFRSIERSLRRAQRGHKGLRDEVRRMENDVTTLARLWFTEEQLLRITMSNGWTRRLLKNSSQL